MNLDTIHRAFLARVHQQAQAQRFAEVRFDGEAFRPAPAVADLEDFDDFEQATRPGELDA